MLTNGIYILRDGGIKTLAGGVLTINDNGFFQVAAQAGVADDLDTITYAVSGVVAAALVILKADAGDTITIKNGIGNIELNSGSDFVMSGDDMIMLAWDGTNWSDIGTGGGTENVSLFSFDVPTELTINAGVVTATSSNHTIDTQGDAPTDNLDTINGGTDRQLLLIRAENTARTVVVKHGTGNIHTLSGTDITLDNTEKALLLYYDGTNWEVIGDGSTGGGGGTVTSVGLSAPAIFSVGGSPVTTSGTIALAFVTQTENTVLAGPTTAPAAAPTFRGLVTADIPNLDASKITSGTIVHERGGLEADVSGYNGFVVISGGTTQAYVIPLLLEYGGTEADLSATGPGAIVQSAGGAALSVEAQLALERGGTEADLSATGPGAIIQNAGGAALSAEAQLALERGGTESDLSATGPGALVQTAGGAAVTVETLDETRGGTGQTTIAKGDLLAGTAANTIGKLSVGADTHVLTADATQGTGMKWAAGGAGAATPVMVNRGITNGGFEVWENGIAAAPDDWAVVGAGATVARENGAGNFKVGLYSAKLTRVGNDCHLSHNAFVDAGGDYIQSRQHTLGAWVKCSAANRARLRIYDGVAAASYSGYHTGGGAFEWLTVSITPNAAASELTCGLQVDNGNTFAYVDGVTLVEGGTLTYTAPQTHEFNYLPQEATLWHDESIVVNGGALVRQLQANQVYNAQFFQGGAAINDEWKQRFWLRAGSYTLYLFGYTDTPNGIVTLSIDGVSQGTQDWYSNPRVYNVVQSTAITVIGDGEHILNGKVAAKNGASGGFFLTLVKMEIR